MFQRNQGAKRRKPKKEKNTMDLKGLTPADMADLRERIPGMDTLTLD